MLHRLLYLSCPESMSSRTNASVLNDEESILAMFWWNIQSRWDGLAYLASLLTVASFVTVGHQMSKAQNVDSIKTSKIFDRIIITSMTKHRYHTMSTLQKIDTEDINGNYCCKGSPYKLVYRFTCITPRDYMIAMIETARCRLWRSVLGLIYKIIYMYKIISIRIDQSIPTYLDISCTWQGYVTFRWLCFWVARLS